MYFNAQEFPTFAPPVGLGMYYPAQEFPTFAPPSGLGCCGCDQQGVGLLSMDGTGLLGTGLFADATNLSTWGWGEYAALGLGLYTLFALTSTTKRGYSTARRKLRRKRA